MRSLNRYVILFLVSGRLATNRENLLPNNPQGCPEEIQAKYPCFFAGKLKDILGYNALFTYLVHVYIYIFMNEKFQN